MSRSHLTLFISHARSLTTVAMVVALTGCGQSTAEGDAALADGNIVRVSMGQSRTSAFVLDALDGTFSLVDTGEATEDETHPVVAAIEAKGGTASDVTDVYFTHGHPDHIGGASLFPNAVFHAFADEEPIITGEAQPERPLPSTGAPEPTGVRVDDFLVDEGQFRVGQRPMRVFSLPGHTVGSAAFLVDGVLLLGDAGYISTDGGYLGATWLFSTDTAENDASLIRLVERIDALGDDVTTLAPAHSGSSFDGIDPLRRYVEALP